MPGNIRASVRFGIGVGCTLFHDKFISSNLAISSHTCHHIWFEFISHQEFMLLLRAGVRDDDSDENLGGDVEDEFAAAKDPAALQHSHGKPILGCASVCP